MKLVERLRRYIDEELTQDDIKRIGAILRNSAYFQVTPIDGEKGTYTVEVIVAGRNIIEIKTKFDEESGQVVYDGYEVEEDELKGLIEFIENRTVDKDFQKDQDK